MKLPVASHTFLNDWDNCPHKAARKHIIKDLPPFQPTEASAWGDRVHKAFELRLNERQPFPEGMEQMEPIAAPLSNAGARGELMLGMTETGEPCGFFDKDVVWLRGKIDATKTNGATVAVIFDWKTGKKREEVAELKVHSVLLRAHYPSIQLVVGHYVWIQDMAVGKAHQITAKAMDDKLADIRSTMNAVKNSIATGFFPKRQNPLCGWCDVLDCEFNPKKGRR